MELGWRGMSRTNDLAYLELMSIEENVVNENSVYQNFFCFKYTASEPLKDKCMRHDTRHNDVQSNNKKIDTQCYASIMIFSITTKMELE